MSRLPNCTAVPCGHRFNDESINSHIIEKGPECPMCMEFIDDVEYDQDRCGKLERFEPETVEEMQMDAVATLIAKSIDSKLPESAKKLNPGENFFKEVRKRLVPRYRDALVQVLPKLDDRVIVFYECPDGKIEVKLSQKSIPKKLMFFFLLRQELYNTTMIEDVELITIRDVIGDVKGPWGPKDKAIGRYTRVEDATGTDSIETAEDLCEFVKALEKLDTSTDSEEKVK